MWIYMTLQAFGEFLVYSCSMRFTMTFLAFWYLAVFDMAGCTLEIRVLGMVTLQVVINLGMT
jgi:hypothetical protein